MRSAWTIFLSVFLAASVATLSSTAWANPKYAAFVMHEGTGDVLFSRYADSRRYPASLTKMMTLYVLFEDIEAGRTSLDDKIKVSSRAARQPASKLGIRSGSTIKVETAIEALVIKSANDVATAVAEHVSGTEVAFARRMTRTARDIGMRSTTFRNASGLPNSRQVTTARDMARLAQRLRQDFPQYQEFFTQTSFRWGGNTYRTHNKLLLNYTGTTGLKTGYTRASGYNLASTAERDGHPLIGVVLGGRSGATRDRHMRDILTRAYRAIDQRPSRIKVAWSRPPVPQSKPGGRAPILLAGAGNTLSSSGTSTADLNYQVLAQSVSALEIGAVIGEGDTDQPDPRDWAVQVGAYRRQDQAMARLGDLQPDISTWIPSAERLILPNTTRGRTLYRARFTGLTADEADDTCFRLRRDGQDCLALPPGR
ncbi:MAG: D-alanyl-D-alanine carboxypeptidase [Pseudomonadota bacterium]